MDDTISIVQTISPITEDEFNEYMNEIIEHESHATTEEIAAQESLTEDLGRVSKILNAQKVLAEEVHQLSLLEHVINEHGVSEPILRIQYPQLLGVLRFSSDYEPNPYSDESKIALEDIVDKLNTLYDLLVKTITKVLYYLKDIVRRIVVYFRRYTAMSQTLANALRKAHVDIKPELELGKSVFVEFSSWQDAYLQLSRIGDIVKPIMKGSTQTLPDDVSRVTDLLIQVIDYPYSKTKTNKLGQINWSIRSITDYDIKIASMVKAFEISGPLMLDRLSWLNSKLHRLSIADRQTHSEETIRGLVDDIVKLRNLYGKYWMLSNDLILQWLAVGSAYTKCIAPNKQ